MLWQSRLRLREVMVITMKYKSSTAVIGIILVIIGIGYVGNFFDVWDFKLFFPGWWTLFIIIPALLKLLRSGFKPIYLITLGTGVIILLAKLGVLPAQLSDLIVPILLLLLGLALIFRGKLNGDIASGESQTAIFSGRTPNYNGKRFDGVYATAIFGGVDLKLAEAEIVDNAAIDIICLFGGVDIKLPANVNVEVSAASMFGGVSEPKNRSFSENNPTVYVNAFCLFGGVSVK